MKKILNHDYDMLVNMKAAITAAEIERQPDVWEKLAEVLVRNNGVYSSFMDRVLAIPDLRIIFTGAGSSAFVGDSMSMLLSRERGLVSECIHTTDLVATPDQLLRDVPTLLVSYSRSGSSPESVGAIQIAQQYVKELYNLVLVCNADSALSKMDLNWDRSLIVNIPQEASDLGFAMTCSVSCMALATWQLFAQKELRQQRWEQIRELAAAARLQMSSLQTQAARIASVDYERMIYLGFGALRGLAQEGSVKSQELTGGRIVSVYNTPTGFRHGPKTVLNDQSMTVHLLSTHPLSRKYDKDMLRELSDCCRKDGLCALVSKDGADYFAEANTDLIVYEEPPHIENKEFCAYIFDLLFIQLLSFEKSIALGITTDNPCPSGEVNRVVQGVSIYLN